mgnify:FL=1
MKKFFLLCAFLLSASSVFSRTGFGLRGGFDCGSSSDTFVSASVRRDTSPWCVSIGAHFSNPVFSSLEPTGTFTAAFDDYFVNERIQEHIDIYVLWGISAGFSCGFDGSGEKDFSVGTGSRFGVGFDFFFFGRHLEFFSEAVWNPYLGVEREGGDFSFMGKVDNFPCSLGFRIWN